MSIRTLEEKIAAEKSVILSSFAKGAYNDCLEEAGLVPEEITEEIDDIAELVAEVLTKLQNRSVFGDSDQAAYAVTAMILAYLG